MTSRVGARTRRALRSLGLLLALAASACGGGEGDPCQERDDCGSALMCCKVSSAVGSRGVCGETCEPLPAGADAGVDATPDSQTDAATTDGPEADGGADGAAERDAEPADADSGEPATDAGDDAGPADGAAESDATHGDGDASGMM